MWVYYDRPILAQNACSSRICARVRSKHRWFTGINALAFLMLGEKSKHDRDRVGGGQARDDQKFASNQTYESFAQEKNSFYTHRIVGGHRHHRNISSHASACIS